MIRPIDLVSMGLEGMLMHANYRLWLNGNSLVLIDDAVSATQAEHLLNVQLSAYIAASKRFTSAALDAAWHKEYLRIQGSFGCSLGTLQASTVPRAGVQALEPWNALQANLLAQLPSTLQASVAACLNTFRASPDESVLELLHAACVRPANDRDGHQLRIELRLILPDASINSTELSCNVVARLGSDWLWQPLASASLQAGRQIDVRYLSQDSQVEMIGAGLRDTLKVKQAQYRRAVRLFPIKESNNE